jgi:hypothetical protein
MEACHILNAIQDDPIKRKHFVDPYVRIQLVLIRNNVAGERTYSPQNLLRTIQVGRITECYTTGGLTALSMGQLCEFRFPPFCGNFECYSLILGD